MRDMRRSGQGVCDWHGPPPRVRTVCGGPARHGLPLPSSGSSRSRCARGNKVFPTNPQTQQRLFPPQSPRAAGTGAGGVSEGDGGWGSLPVARTEFGRALRPGKMLAWRSACGFWRGRRLGRSPHQRREASALLGGGWLPRWQAATLPRSWAAPGLSPRACNGSGPNRPLECAGSFSHDIVVYPPLPDPIQTKTRCSSCWASTERIQVQRPRRAAAPHRLPPRSVTTGELVRTDRFQDGGPEQNQK